MSRGDNRTNLKSREERNRHKLPVSIHVDSKGMIRRFTENIDKISGLFNLYDYLQGAEKLAEAEDILRYQIVYLMSSLDFYMHELYSYGLLKIFQKQKKKTYRYLEYRVPLELVELALFDGENIMRYLKKSFIESNSSFTFMHPHRIKEVLNTISEEEAFYIVENKLRSNQMIKSHDELESIIDRIYKRRNKISHQTDIDHGKTEKNDINKVEVEKYVEIIKTMVLELHRIICTE